MNDVQKMLVVVNHIPLSKVAKLVGCSAMALSKIKLGYTNAYNVKWCLVTKIAKLYDVDMKG